MKSLEQHQIDIGKIKLGDKPCSLRESTALPSHITRTKRYQSSSASLDINHLNKIICIDTVNLTVTVEPKVTFGELVKATLKEGLIPLVVPEFKSITVGGAIMGASLESSSHHFGQVNDCAIEYEVLLGDESIVFASKEENSDLFYGLSSSYGTLGILLSCTLKLAKASKYIHLSYTHVDSFEGLKKTLENSLTCDYVEAIIYSKKHSVIITGKTHSGNGIKKYRLFPWKKWFYKHAEEAFEDELIPTYDYLFRYDRGAFWMGSYLSNLRWIGKYFFCPHFKETHFKLSPVLNRLIPFFLGAYLTTQRLYKALHSISDAWFQKTFVIQDFYVPEENLLEFLLFIDEEIGVTPLWICPMKPTKAPQILAPHFIETKLLFDVGIYGIPNNSEGIALTKKLEEKCHNLRGKKMHYAYSYYTKEKFWEIYSQASYEHLRQKFKAPLHFLPIDEKIL